MPSNESIGRERNDTFPMPGRRARSMGKLVLIVLLPLVPLGKL